MVKITLELSEEYIREHAESARSKMLSTDNTDDVIGNFVNMFSFRRFQECADEGQKEFFLSREDMVENTEKELFDHLVSRLGVLFMIREKNKGFGAKVESAVSENAYGGRSHLKNIFFNLKNKGNNGNV